MDNNQMYGTFKSIPFALAGDDSLFLANGMVG
jgi:hypothetical protein